MKAEYRDDSQKGAGYGQLIFTEALIPDAPWHLAIQRGSDHGYLSGKNTGQWLGERIYIPLQGVVDENGALSLEVGPEIVDSLTPVDQYQLYLKNDASDPQKARLKVGEITYSPTENLDNTAKAVQETVAQQPTPKPEPKPAPAPEPEPAPQNVAAEALDDSLELTPPPPPHPNRKLLRYCLFALLALACVAWYVIDLMRDKEAETPGNVAIEEPKKQDTPAPAQNLPNAPAMTAEARVGGFFAAANATPQAAFDLSKQLPNKTTADQDAIYRLYYYAAENDVPAALMAYGACIDPSKPKWGTIEKDAPLAWAIYERAKGVEPKEAEAAQKNLLAWLKNKASSSDSQAAAWLKAVEK